MGLMFIKARISISAFFMWVAARVAPSEVQSVIQNHMDATYMMMGEIEQGRTFGVLTACWAITEDGYENARQMQAAAMKALADKRYWLEKGQYILRGNPCGEIKLPPYVPKSKPVTDPSFGIDL